MEDNKREVLMQSKSVVNTSYSVTAIQNRIFYNCLFNAQKEKNGALCCHIHIDNIKKMITNNNQKNIESIKEAFVVLKNTSLAFERIDDGDKIECDYNLIMGTEYNTDKEEFKIYFPERLYNHIMEYTVYAPLNLAILSKFTSFYAQRLYESLRLWSRTEKTISHEFTIEHLRFIFAVENKYPLYKNFKQKVLSQAVKEINEKGNMDVEIEEIKKGRKVIKINFIMTDHEVKKYFTPNTNVNDNKLLIEKDEILKDASGNDVHVKQKAFDIEELYNGEKKAPSGRRDEAKKLQIIRDTLEIPYVSYFKNTLDKFTMYCYRNQMDFSRSSILKKIMAKALEITKEKTNEFDILDTNYNYFISTLEGIKREQLESLKRAEINEVMYDLVNGTEEKKEYIENQHDEILRKMYLGNDEA